MIPFGAMCADAISTALSKGAITRRTGGTDSTCTALYEELAWAEDEGKNESPQGFACGGPEPACGGSEDEQVGWHLDRLERVRQYSNMPVHLLVHRTSCSGGGSQRSYGQDKFQIIPRFMESEKGKYVGDKIR